MSNIKIAVINKISAMDEEEAIETIIHDMWQVFDLDGNGTLDFDEAKKFVIEGLSILQKSHRYSEETFKILFNKFDEDESRSLDRDELKELLMEIS